MANRTFTFPDSLIERVVDGDSMRVLARWEKPFYIHPEDYPIALRIAGVDCEPGGPAAGKQRTEKGQAAYVRAHELTQYKRLTVVTYEQYAYGGPQGTIGEWVGDIMVPWAVDGVPGAVMALSTILLAEGLAVPYDGKGKRPSAL